MRTTTTKPANRRPARVKTAVTSTCATCTKLDETPVFTDSLIALHKLTQATVQQWYHQNEHTVFVK